MLSFLAEVHQMLAEWTWWNIVFRRASHHTYPAVIPEFSISSGLEKDQNWGTVRYLLQTQVSH